MNEVKKDIVPQQSLSEVFSMRISEEDRKKITVVARENYISDTELVRNLIRDHIHEYCVSNLLRKKLLISNRLEAFFLKKSVISDRNNRNLDEIISILVDFEQFLKNQSKKVNFVEIQDKYTEINELMNLIANEDEFLFSEIEGYYSSILKNKHIKGLVCEQLKDLK